MIDGNLETLCGITQRVHSNLDSFTEIPVKPLLARWAYRAAILTLTLIAISALILSLSYYHQARGEQIDKHYQAMRMADSIRQQRSN